MLPDTTKPSSTGVGARSPRSLLPYAAQPVLQTEPNLAGPAALHAHSSCIGITFGMHQPPTEGMKGWGLTF